jgi:50S ribosomal protein L16 3-hydroxylase
MLATLLGGLTPQQFLERHWQKRPLLVRQALPGFAGVMDRDALLALALLDGVESRRVECVDQRWAVKHGPLGRRDLGPRGRPWTVLVQGVNLHVPAADRLLRGFDFVPWARLDDLMISYATDGGGVGPHFDSYDVFLIQAHGRRRWRIGAQRDLNLIEDAPLRILRDFRPTREWILEPGDMLYLPPHYAHDGIAIGECMTCSIGFRAPSVQELAVGFLAHLEERIDLPGRYGDPELAPTRHPGEIPAAMLHKVAGLLDRIRWNAADVREFLGSHLSEPKPHVFFTPPAAPLPADQFARRCAASGLRLDPRTQMLYSGRQVFINGEALAADAGDMKALRALADWRSLPTTSNLDPTLIESLYQWYVDGFVLIGAKE